MSRNKIHAHGPCEHCGKATTIPLPDALVALLAGADDERSVATELADRLQRVAFMLHKLQDELIKGDRFETIESGRVQEILEAVITPTKARP